MQSTDWPDLPFVKPAAYGTGRDGHTAMVSVIHYTAGSERSTSAEDGAAYDARRTDGTSTTYFHDRDSTIQCVLLVNRANAAFHHGNRIGIHHELCGTAQTRAQWLDEASRPTIRRAAKQIVRDHKRLGIPLRRLSPAGVRACWFTNDRSIGGICGHVDITEAFPEDNGTHTDPGEDFPWDVLFSDINYYARGGFLMALNDEQQNDIWEWIAAQMDPNTPATGRKTDRFHFPSPFQRVLDRLDTVGTPTQDQVNTAVKAALADPEVAGPLAELIVGKLGALRFEPNGGVQ